MAGETMSIREAADRLSVSYFTVYKAVKEGEIEARRIGAVYHVDASSVEAYRQCRDEAARYDKRRAVRL